MISAFYIEGAGYQENLLPRAHKRMGMDVTIITSQYCFNSKNKVGSRPAGTYINNDGIKVIVLEDNKRLPFISPFQNKCKNVKKTLVEEVPDLIFMHNIEYMDSREVAQYASKMKIPLFCDNHSDFYNTPSKGILNLLLKHVLRIPLAKYISKRARIIWGTTPWRVQYLQQYYKIPASKTDFLVMGADESLIHWDQRLKIRNDIRKKYGFQEEDFLIITGGKINKEKNIHILARAVSKINRSNVKLLIFGDVDEYVKKELDSCSNDHIKSIGWINSNAVYDLFLASDLGFFPGTHSVLWEQVVACGLPAVFKYWDGMKHVDVNGNAILLKDISVESIEYTIVNILTDYSKYIQMRDNAITARNGFMYGTIARRSIGLQA